MNNGIEDPTAGEQASADMPMDSPEKLEKGKGKMALPADLMDEDDSEESEEDEEVEGEAEGEAEEADEDNMEEIDLDNIVGTRTRGKNIDYAQAAKDFPEEEDDEEDEDDEDFEGDDMMEE